MKNNNKIQVGRRINNPKKLGYFFRNPHVKFGNGKVFQGKFSCLKTTSSCMGGNISLI